MEKDTLKPFHDPGVLEAIDRARSGVIAVENHSIVGGLGSAVAEVMAERGAPKRLVRLGLRDEYAHGASRPYLMREYGLDALAIARAAEELTGDRFDLPPDAFDGFEVAPGSPGAKAEDL